jgi:glycosyltransferase involved in cell wall biosynthesis
LSVTQKSILFFCSDGDSLVNFRGTLIRDFVNKGYKVSAIAPNISKENKHFLQQLNVRLSIISFQRKSMNPISTLLSFAFLVRIIYASKPEIVFSYTHKPVVLGALASYFCRVPRIISLITGTGHIFDQYSMLTRIKRFLGLTGFRLALKASHFVIFQNKDDRSLFLELGLVTSAKTHVVNGSGVDLDHFQQFPHPSELTFLCLARLIKSKGLYEYAQACQLVREQLPNAKFLLGGSPDTHNDSINFKEIQDSWKIKYGIDYIGHIQDVREVIKESSVYVLLSYNEGTPRTVLEAMSMGRPIITTDINGCRETVKAGVNGYLVPIYDYKEAARKMLEFADKDMIKTMGNESRKYCEEKYDVHKVNASIFQIIES